MFWRTGIMPPQEKGRPTEPSLPEAARPVNPPRGKAGPEELHFLLHTGAGRIGRLGILGRDSPRCRVDTADAAFLVS